VRGLPPVSDGGLLWTSELGASPCYGGLKIPPAPGLQVRCFCYGERRRKAREEVTIVLAFGYALRAHEALGRPDALPGFLQVVHRLFEDAVILSHDRSIRTSGSLRSADCFTFSLEQAEYAREREDRGRGSLGSRLLIHLENSGNSNSRPNPDTHLTPPQRRSRLFVVQEGSQWEVKVWEIQFVGFASG
jgi:hypothetical protein